MTALAAIKPRPVMLHYSRRAFSASVYRFGDFLFIETAANANDHENKLQMMRVIVNNEFWLMAEIFENSRATGKLLTHSI